MSAGPFPPGKQTGRKAMQILHLAVNILAPAAVIFCVLLAIAGICIGLAALLRRFAKFASARRSAGIASKDESVNG